MKQLLIAEFAINNHTSSSTKVTPFFTNYNRHPRLGISVEAITPRNLVGPAKWEVSDANEFTKELEGIYETLGHQIAYAQGR